MKDLEIGDVVVCWYNGYPHQHNSKNYPSYPCRGIVMRTTKKFVFVSSTVGELKCVQEGETAKGKVNSFRAMRVEQSRVLWEKINGRVKTTIDFVI